MKIGINQPSFAKIPAPRIATPDELILDTSLKVRKLENLTSKEEEDLPLRVGLPAKFFRGGDFRLVHTEYPWGQRFFFGNFLI